jgi:hypothetical protein
MEKVKDKLIITGQINMPKWLRIGVVSMGILGISMTQFVSSCTTETIEEPGETITLSVETMNPADFYLGAASTFSVIGGAAGITNQGLNTVINGDMATTGAGTLITGFTDSVPTAYTVTGLNNGAVSGTVYTATNDLVTAYAALADAQALYTKLASVTGGEDIGAQLGGKTLKAGVYKSAAAYDITSGDLTLDGDGDADSVWIFQMGSSLTVGASGAPRSIILTNGALAKNVYWQVGSAATINYGGGGYMVGTVISQAGTTIATAGTVDTKFNGRAFALFASVTMVNTIFNDSSVITDPVVVEAPLPASHITLSGTAVGATHDITAVITGTGYIVAENNGGHMNATLTGWGFLDLVNNGAAFDATLTGNGLMTIRNNVGSGVITVTSTGNGVMSITNTSSAALTVTNTSDANITLTSSGAAANTYTWGAPDGMNPTVVCAAGTCVATP